VPSAHLSSFTRNAHDDDGQVTTPHLLANKLNSIHLGMIKSQVQNVGIQLLDFFERIFSVASRAHHLEKRTTRKHLCDDLSDVGGVVNDQYPLHFVHSSSSSSLPASPVCLIGHDPQRVCKQRVADINELEIVADFE